MGGWGGGFYVLLSTSPRYFLSHSHLQYLWQLNVSQETEWKVEVTAPEDSLLYPLCPASHILKTVRISQSSKSRPCTKVTSLSFEYSNINVIIPPLLIAYCIHLHSGFAKNNRKSTVIVKHIYTHSSLPHLSLYHCNDCCTQHS